MRTPCQSMLMCLGLATLLPAGIAPAQDGPADESKKTPTIAEKTVDMEALDGLLRLHLDRAGGAVWLELSPPADATGEIGRYLYVEGLRTGLGSNPVGLDRGQLGGEKIIRIRRLGPNVLFEQINLGYRALTDDDAERRAVDESFATSVLWGGKIGAIDPDGRSLVDLTPFIVRDAHDVAATLKRSDQGAYRLDEKRSVFDPAACLAFPDNLEFEAILTFAGEEPGGHVRSTAPAPKSITLVQHHSLIRLPDDDYSPRRFDPRTSSSPVRFVDFASPLDQPLEKRWISRHRLQKTNPGAARSPVRDPIVYYVDRGAPEPVRSALIEGASWWAEAFEAAGFIDAFRVEVMPEGAHPLDVRYNVIQWVHRSTRGWSYGGSVSDPRTGEIIKGHVSLGSLRVRQDRLIFEGLAGTGNTGTGRPDDPVQLSLARIRQLSAHEVGHTLGFAHNFAASTDGRASVMDYPAPLITIAPNGGLDFSDAYATGIGAWDTHAVRYAYSQFAPGADEEAELTRIIQAGRDQGLHFISDSDARPLGSAHPRAHLWDNGSDPVTGLRQSMDVRRIAIDNFSLDNLPDGQPLALLQEVFVPVFLHHRYQLVAAVKLVGGLEYDYQVKGDGRAGPAPLGAARQEAALQAVLDCIDPGFLTVPSQVVRLIPPRPFGYGGNRELFNGSTSPALDPLDAAATAADIAVTGLLEPHRCARLLDQHSRDQTALGLDAMLERLIDAVFDAQPALDPTQAEVRRVTQQVLVERLIGLAAADSAAAGVRAGAEQRLKRLTGRLRVRADRAADARAEAHLFSLLDQINRHLSRETSGERDRRQIPPQPPGDPIGSPIGPEWGDCGMNFDWN